jgi:hypothetical protein
LSWTAFSGGTGAIIFSGLPYPTKNTVNLNAVGSIGQANGFTFGAGLTQLVLIANKATSFVIPEAIGSAAATTNIPAANLAQTGNIQFTITYLTD